MNFGNITSLGGQPITGSFRRSRSVAPPSVVAEQQTSDSAFRRIMRRDDGTSQNKLVRKVINGKEVFVKENETVQNTTKTVGAAKENLEIKKITQETGGIHLRNVVGRTKASVTDDTFEYTFKAAEIINHWYDVSKLKIYFEITETSLTYGDIRSMINNIQIDFSVKSEQTQTLNISPYMSSVCSRHKKAIPKTNITPLQNGSVLSGTLLDFAGIIFPKSFYMKKFNINLQLTDTKYWPLSNGKPYIRISVICPNVKGPELPTRQQLVMPKYKLWGEGSTYRLAPDTENGEKGLINTVTACEIDDKDIVKEKLFYTQTKNKSGVDEIVVDIGKEMDSHVIINYSVTKLIKHVVEESD